MVALVAAIAVLVVGVMSFSGRAWAAWVDLAENGLPGHLTLASDAGPTPNFMDMSPGAVEYWQIDVSLADPSSPLTMQFARNGELVDRPDGLWIEGKGCSVEWTMSAPPTCSGTMTNAMPGKPASDASYDSSPVMDMGTITSAQDRFLLVTLSIPDSPEARADETLMGLSATVGFGFTASGDEVVTPPTPPSSLAKTGADILAIALMALGAVGLGLVVRSARRARLLGSDEGIAR